MKLNLTPLPNTRLSARAADEEGFSKTDMALARRVDELTQAHFEMATYLQSVSSNYAAVVSELAQCQRNLANQDLIMQNLLQYLQSNNMTMNTALGSSGVPDALAGAASAASRPLQAAPQPPQPPQPHQQLHIQPPHLPPPTSPVFADSHGGPVTLARSASHENHQDLQQRTFQCLKPRSNDRNTEHWLTPPPASSHPLSYFFSFVPFLIVFISFAPDEAATPFSPSQYIWQGGDASGGAAQPMTLWSPQDLANAMSLSATSSAGAQPAETTSALQNSAAARASVTQMSEIARMARAPNATDRGGGSDGLPTSATPAGSVLPVVGHAGASSSDPNQLLTVHTVRLPPHTHANPPFAPANKK